jgi:quercetin dioxygenase-like cupin family protein
MTELIDHPQTSAHSPSAITSPGPSYSPDDLCALVRSYASDPSSWASRLRYPAPGEDRWWTRLEGPAGADVWLLSWLPGHTTQFHDHGDSVAAFQVVEGSLLEVRPSTSGQPGCHVRRTGDVVVVPAGDVHDVIANDQVAVSIHAYSPPLEQMTYYRLGRGGALEPFETVVTDDPEEGPRR